MTLWRRIQLAGLALAGRERDLHEATSPGPVPTEVKLCDTVEIGPTDKLIAIHCGKVPRPDYAQQFVREGRRAIESFLGDNNRATILPNGPWTFIVVRRTDGRGAP